MACRLALSDRPLEALPCAETVGIDPRPGRICCRGKTDAQPQPGRCGLSSAGPWEAGCAVGPEDPLQGGLLLPAQGALRTPREVTAGVSFPPECSDFITLGCFPGLNSSHSLVSGPRSNLGIGMSAEDVAACVLEALRGASRLPPALSHPTPEKPCRAPSTVPEGSRGPEKHGCDKTLYSQKKEEPPPFATTRRTLRAPC